MKKQKSALKQKKEQKNHAGENKDDVRIDKWLWAARFCKTRSIARELVQSGKVQYNKQRSKP
ncbi:MAG: S4 domain-containing protein, partial [Glaciecola sp.]